MATRTQEIFGNMDYFLVFKESGGAYCDAYSKALMGLADIFGNQVANGLHTKAEIEAFKGTLPGTSDIFNRAEMHPDLSVVPKYFSEAVKVNMASLSQQSGRVR